MKKNVSRPALSPVKP